MKASFRLLPSYNKFDVENARCKNKLHVVDVDGSTTIGGLRTSFEDYITAKREADAGELVGCHWYVEQVVVTTRRGRKGKEQTIISKEEIEVLAEDQEELFLDIISSLDVEVQLGTVEIRLKGKTGDLASRYTTVYDAASDGNVVAIEMLLSKGLNAKTSNVDGMTPLQIAAREGHVAAIDVLIDKGNADPDGAKWRDKLCPLHHVAKRGHLKAAEVLLRYGADPTVKNADGFTPLHMAAAHGFLDMVEYLADSGCQVDATATGRTVLHSAASYGHVEVIDALVVRHRVAIDALTGDGATALHLAAANGHTKAIAALVAHGADLYAGPIASPLHAAADNNQPESVDALIELGVHVDMASRDGSTALDVSLRKSNTEALKALLAQGASIHTNKAPLHVAVQQKNVVAAELLSDAGADVNLVNYDSTPLDAAAVAAMGREVALYKYLLTQGAYFGPATSPAFNRSMTNLLKRYL